MQIEAMPRLDDAMERLVQVRTARLAAVEIIVRGNEEERGFREEGRRKEAKVGRQNELEFQRYCSGYLYIVTSTAGSVPLSSFPFLSFLSSLLRSR